MASITSNKEDNISLDSYYTRPKNERQESDIIDFSGFTLINQTTTNDNITLSLEPTVSFHSLSKYESKQEYRKSDYLDSSCYSQEDSTQEDSTQETQESGTIGIFDFYIWTMIPAIGIIFCLLHSEQEHLWTWTGSTAKEAQSLQAKVVVSVMSTIIGACVTATLMKTISSVSFTLTKYRGAHFSQLTTMIGGYSPSYIPMLVTGKAWTSIVIIVLVLIIGATTKQLASVSMTLCLLEVRDTMISSIRNYTTCDLTDYGNPGVISQPQSSWDAFNSLLNPNLTFSNEHYDRSIPMNLKGYSQFERVLPFSQVSCRDVPWKEEYTRMMPIINYVPSTNNTSSPLIEMTMGYNDGLVLYEEIDWMNCSVLVGYATALTSCNDTLCDTRRISEITPYENAGHAISTFFTNMFGLIFPESSLSRNLLIVWLLGYDSDIPLMISDPLEFKGFPMTEERTEIMATVSTRLLCDQNTKNIEYTQFESNYVKERYYAYIVAWKWPFWLLSALIFLSWTVCMSAMWLTPESRLISLDWLLGQYIYKEKWCYLSGLSLVKTHKDSLFQVVDEYSDKDVGKIIISEAGAEEDARKDLVLREKQYQ